MFPRLIDLGPITLHSYGLLLAAAFLVSIGLVSRLAKESVLRNRAWDLGFIIIVSAVLGAKLLLVLTDLDGYLQRPSRLLSLEFWQAGGVYYGGFIGAVVGIAIYIWRSPDLKFLTVADAAAPAIALGQSIGRLGCFAAGCDYGKPANLPWAVTFTSEYAHKYIGVPIHVPLHPAQLYESLTTFFLFWVLLWIYKNKRFAGQVFCLYLVLYGVARFGLEFFRGDVDRGFVFGGLLSTSQFISLLIFPAGIVAYFYFRSRSLRRSGGV
ncbi:prolipoprotein diacylglyceryl transferase [Acidobacteria bacterium AH-259-A15]|nr:prolipoprotein diacylglyceryl transferase [Acidobacteria bacterium AH-259-A15]